MEKCLQVAVQNATMCFQHAEIFGGIDCAGQIINIFDDRMGKVVVCSLNLQPTGFILIFVVSV